MLTQDEALAKLKRQLARAGEEDAADPQLTEEEIAELLADAAVGTLWEAGTEYAFGQRVFPSAANGTLWEVILAGTGGETEPTWPLYGVAYEGYSLQDGDALLRYAGRAPAQRWDLKAAEHAGWKRKLALASERFDFEYDDPSQSVNYSQTFRNLERMVARTAPFGVV